MKQALFKVAHSAMKADQCMTQLKSDMRRAWREHIPLEEIAQACGMSTQRAASIVGAEQPKTGAAAPAEIPGGAGQPV